MDLSSLTETQRQQLNDLQQRFQEHQLQQQQQQQQQQQVQEPYQQPHNHDYASQSHEISQIQAYNNSYYQYYQHQQPQHEQYQNQPQHEQQYQQQYACYQPDNANAYQQQPSAMVLSEGAGAPQMMDGASDGMVHPQQNAFYPQRMEPQLQLQNQRQQQQTSAEAGGTYPVPPGLNPAAAAAVAALSQLTQFAGTMGAAERAMAGLQWQGKTGGSMPTMGPYHRSVPVHQPAGRSKSGGRRGGGPFTGNSRGSIVRSNSRPIGSGPSFRGRGGRGRGRGSSRGGSSNFTPNNASSNTGPSSSEHAESTKGAEPPSADASEKGKAALNQRPAQAAKCEICKIECTSLEILEQHKNGKRHKKNMQRMGPEPKIQNDQKAPGEPNPEAGDEDKKETEQPNAIEGGPAPNLRMINQFNHPKRGMKRKMRGGGGRGGKRVKIFDGPRRPHAEPSKPKVVIPLVCNLCNVKCDTKDVFDRHLAGKKHLSKQKRFEGHRAMYGPMVEALYPPNPLAQTHLLPPQGLQQAYYEQQGPYPPPGAAHMPPEAHQGAGFGTHFLQNSQFQGQEATPGHQQNATDVQHGMGPSY